MYLLGCLTTPINQNHTIVMHEQGEATAADLNSHSHYLKISSNGLSAGFSRMGNQHKRLSVPVSLQHTCNTAC